MTMKTNPLNVYVKMLYIIKVSSSMSCRTRWWHDVQ